MGEQVNITKWGLIFFSLLGSAGIVLAEEFCAMPISKEAMYQDEAELYCKKFDLRLPTTRELADFTKKYGAKGISEFPLDNHYESIRAIDLSGNSDSFFYSHEGYEPEKFKVPRLWTSQYLDELDGKNYYGYAFHPSGEFMVLNPEWDCNVCCVK